MDSLRRTPLPYPDLCTQLFEGATATTSTLPHPTQESSHYSLHDFDDIDCTQQETVGLSDESSAQSKKQKTTDTAKSQNKSKDKGKDAANSRLLEIGEDIATIAKIFVEKHASSNLSACMEKLEKLGWGIFDPRYTTVVASFGEGADKRHV